MAPVKMKKLLRAFTLLLAYLSLIFGCEALGFWKTGSIQIHQLDYLEIFIAVLALLLLPALLRFSQAVIVTGCAVIYLSARWVVYPNDALLGGINSYQMITELVLLSIAVGLAGYVSRLFYRVEAAVENTLMPEANSRVRQFDHMAEEIKTEIIRSRRYAHPLSILVVEPAQGSLQKNMQEFLNEVENKLTRRFITNNLKEVISRQARRTDMVLSRDQEDRFYILCPENTSHGVIRLAQRVEAELQETLGISISFGVASFPKDALTFEDLVFKAENNLKSHLMIGLQPEQGAESVDVSDHTRDTKQK